MNNTDRKKLKDLRYIRNMRFPIKLYNACESKNILSINWSLNEDTSFLIDLKELESYLKKVTSIFLTNNVSQFINELKKYDFKEINQDNSDSEYIKKFYHKYFLRGRPELLEYILKDVEMDELRPNIEGSHRLLKLKLQGKLDIDKIRGDLCLNNKSTPAVDTVSGFEKNSNYAGFYGHYDIDAEKVKKFNNLDLSTKSIMFSQSHQSINDDEIMQIINSASSNYENRNVFQDSKENQIFPDDKVIIGFFS